ncbi:MAG: hypothetical protein QOF84_4176 [Streptomyces sp.]|nr:hypothetical protein [Streptomyces sp.]
MTTPGNTKSHGTLGWILDEHILRLPHTLRALVLSADGLRIFTSQDAEPDMADRLAANVSGMQALSREAAEFADCKGGPWEMTMIKYGSGFLFIMAAGAGTYLAVSASKDADAEAVSYAMEKTIDRLGQEMNVAARDSTDRPS